MKEIKELTDNIKDELHDAKKYAKLALKYKESRPRLSVLYDALSRQEMEHMTALHKEVTIEIEEYRREHGAPPAPMQARYDILHELFVEKAEKVKRLQAMFRE